MRRRDERAAGNDVPLLTLCRRPRFISSDLLR